MRPRSEPIVPSFGHIERPTVLRRREAAEKPGQVDIVFDGPPGHESGRFVEVEDLNGASVSVGDWIERPNGQWALRLSIATVEVPRTGPSSDADIVAAVLAAHGIPDRSAAEHAIEMLRAQGRLR